jgi:hypothetical protein
MEVVFAGAMAPATVARVQLDVESVTPVPVLEPVTAKEGSKKMIWQAT